MFIRHVCEGKNYNQLCFFFFFFYDDDDDDDRKIESNCVLVEMYL